MLSSAGPVRAISPSRILLDTQWELARAPSQGNVTAPEELESFSLQWQRTVIPGTVAATLRESGGWSWESPTEIDASEWWYRCHFSRDELRDILPTPESGNFAERVASSDIALVFDGLATLADVWLNGTHILRSENMFCSSKVPVGTLLRETNTLYIRFAALNTELSKRRPRPAWRTRLVSHQQLRWIRTTLLGRMPGWSAGPQAVGPWRGVAFEVNEPFAIVSQTLRSELHEDRGIVYVDLRLRDVSIDNTRPDSIRRVIDGATCTIEGHDTLLTCEVQCEIQGDDTIVQGSVIVDNPERWWPHTHGSQHRYHVNVTLQVDGQSYTIDCGLLAFRDITLDTSRGNFEFRVNDIPVFCRGACWSTLDVVSLGGTRQAYRDALLLARDAGFNMLRVGGTMIYEDDVFYELCDELGILVWHDFMFANMDYPFTDEGFAQTVREEVTQFLQRTQKRACLALLCGNSEIEQQTAMLGFPRERWSNSFFQETLPTLCAEFRADVPYWPSSPSGGALPFHVDAGDSHYFGYGPYLRPYDDVRTSGVRFASETLAFAHVPDQETIDHIPGGASGAGHHPGWKAGVPRDNGSSWDFEDVRDYYVGQLFNLRPAELRYTDHERYLALGRVASGEVIARAISYWRRPTSGCHGALLWFYRDLRPGAGWGIIDALETPKAAYYFARRASCPVAVFISDEGLNGLTLTVVNETPQSIQGTLTLSLYKMGEIVMGSSSQSIDLAPRSFTEVRGDTMFEGFRDLSYAYRFGPPNHDLVVATLQYGPSGTTSDPSSISEAFFFPLGLPANREGDLGLTAAASRLEDGRYELTIRTRRFAQSVAIDVPHFRPDDNYFHIAPNSSRKVLLLPLRSVDSKDWSARRPSGTVTALNSDVSSRFVGD